MVNPVLQGLLPSVILLSVSLIPPALAVGMAVWSKRREERDERRSPLKEKLLHQPGSQARKQYEELGDEIMLRLLMLCGVGPMTMLALLLPRVRWAKLHLGIFEWGLVAGASVAVVVLIRQMLAMRRKRRRWRAGMLAEMATAQELDRLRGKGCLVFHDLPAGNAFNIDHVVVGPSAVYMVETKSRRKSGTGRESANVRYDGAVLAFPTWRETKPLDQARAQARWLADYLQSETGVATPVVAVLCLPGWYVTLEKQAPRGDVLVINPKFQMQFTVVGRRPAIDAPQRIRIETALSKRYPELDDDP